MIAPSPYDEDCDFRDMDPQDQEALSSYCTELERILTDVQDETSFLDRVRALDQRCAETWFAQRYGQNVDPMQIFRQPPHAGTVRSPGAGGCHPGAGSNVAGLGDLFYACHSLDCRHGQSFPSRAAITL